MKIRIVSILFALVVWAGCSSDVLHHTEDNEILEAISDSTLCGNGNVDSSEQCDGENLSGKTCSSFEVFLGGTLKCSSCAFDFSACEARAVLGTPSIISAPSQLTHGTSATIHGAGFGMKEPARPLIWESFDDGFEGQKITQANSDWIYGGTRPENGPEWDDGESRTGQGLNSLITFAPKSTREIIWQPIPSGYGSRLFFSAWFRTTYDGSGADHLKTWRLADGPIDRDTYPDVSNNYTHGGFVRFSNGTGASYKGDTGCPDDGRLWPSRIPANQWGNMSTTIQVNSSAGACDGGYEYFTDFVSQGGPEQIVMGSDATDSNVYEMLWLGNYLKNGTQTEYVRWDDVYFDDTWARVSIGSDSIYENCTHMEMQIPSAWSDGEISFEVNEGTLSTSQQLYLFVVNRDGKASVGYPVHIQ